MAALLKFVAVEAEARGKRLVAKLLLKRLVPVRKSIHGEQSAAFIDHLEKYSLFLYRNSDLDDAKRSYREVLRLSEAVHGKDSSEYREALGSVVGVLLANGEPGEALQYLASLLALDLKLFGGASIQVGITSGKLGQAFYALGDNVKAEQHLLEARNIIIQLVASRDGRSAYITVTHDLGQLRKRQGRLHEAEALFNEAIAKDEQITDHSTHASALSALADLSSARGNLTTAILLRKRALQRIKLEVGWPSQNQSSQLIDDLSQEYIKAKTPLLVKPLLADLRQLDRKSLSVVLNVGMAKMRIAVALSAIPTEVPTVQSLLTEIFSETENDALARGNIGPEALALLSLLSMVAERPSTAGAYDDRFLQALTSVTPESLLKFEAILFNLGRLWWIRDDLARAKELYVRAMDLRRSNATSPWDPERMEGAIALATIHRDLGELTDSRRLSEEVAAASEVLWGGKDARTIRTYAGLRDIMVRQSDFVAADKLSTRLTSVLSVALESGVKVAL